MFFSFFILAGNSSLYSNFFLKNGNYSVSIPDEKVNKRAFTVLSKNLFKSSREIRIPSGLEEFNQEYIQTNYPVDSISNSNLLKAKAAFTDLDQSQNYIDFFSPNDILSLPIGIKKEIGNITYSMGIIKAHFTPEYNLITAFVRIVIPQKDENGKPIELFFGAENIKLSHKGGLYETAKLVLLGDVPIRVKGGNLLFVLKGGFDMNLGDFNSNSYVSVDCEGFKELSIVADVLFPRSIIEPVDSNYTVISNPNTKVTGHFQTIVKDWNNILAEITLSPFQISNRNSKDGSGKGGVVFDLNTAVFDFSDFKNSPNIIFPEEYQSTYLVSGNENLWRGVYVNSLQIILPEYFRKKSSQDRIQFNAHHLLIDGMGVSGNFEVENLIPLHEGDASGWQFSLEHFNLNFVTNSIVGAGFDGKIVLPTSEEVQPNETADQIKQKALQYQALIDLTGDNYRLTVGAQEELKFNLFNANVKLTPNSYVQLEVKEKRFKPKAVLFGELSIKPEKKSEKDSNSIVEFEGIRFENLQLQTEAPFFQVAHMGYEGKALFANFPVTISNIGITAMNDIAALHFDIAINLMGETNGFAGNSSLSIVAGLDQNSEFHRWKFKRIETEKIKINADLGRIKMEGYVEIKSNDPNYGNGFYGELAADFNNIKVSASAWFGKTDYRYWYVDAFADLTKTQIPIKIGPVNLNGFGGGAYYHMTRSSNTSPIIYNGEKIKMGPPSPSGLSYHPDKNTKLGFRALIGFALENESAFNGRVGFEMNFNNSGGINRIFFFGEGHMMKTLNFQFGNSFKGFLSKMETKINLIEKSNAYNNLKTTNLVNYSKIAFPQDGMTFDFGIDAFLSMEMDFKNSVFHSQMEVYVNTPNNFFSGIGNQGRAGWAVFHAAPSEWYLHVGTPKDRVGLRLGINELSLRTSSYLMIGDHIPESPPPPPIVAQILGTDIQTLNYMRDLNALGSGRGFALGMDLSLDTGDMTFLVFYARFQAGLGFDIMLKDYGEASCKGSGAIGINGWYANGQAYAYLQGELGIQVKLLTIHKKIPIINAGAAVLLQAKLPNPVWLRGYLGGNFEVLNGLVKGKYRFKIELGEKCELINGGPLDGLTIISDLSPSNSAQNVDVFTSPQVAFNMKINTPFQLEDDQGTKTYRILLEEFKLTESGKLINGVLEWNSNKDVVNFLSHEILPPKANLKASVKVIFQVRNANTWVTMKENGKVAEEKKEVSFTTGDAPTNIPFRNITYCYPVIDQKYFHINENGGGYIKLNQGQEYLFYPATDWQQKLEIFGPTGKLTAQNLIYNKSQRRVEFNLPNLEKDKNYTLKIISYPPRKSSINVVANTQYQSRRYEEENIIEVRNRKAQSIINEAVENEIIAFQFRTSHFGRFAEKMYSKKTNSYFINLMGNGVYSLEASGTPSEPFELLEILGNKYTNNKPLIQIEAALDDAYYKNQINPLLYKNYPLRSDFTVLRNINIYGLPPKRAVNPISSYISFLENDVNDYFLRTKFPYLYNLPFFYNQDYIDLTRKISTYVLNNYDNYEDMPQTYVKFLTTKFPAMPMGDYKVISRYFMPNGNTGSSSTVVYKKNF